MGTQTGTPPQVIPTLPFPVPRLAALARHATPHLLETTLIPLGLFYGGLQLFGLWGALLAALVWSYTSLLRRLLTRRRVPGMLLLAIVGLTARPCPRRCSPAPACATSSSACPCCGPRCSWPTRASACGCWSASHWPPSSGPARSPRWPSPVWPSPPRRGGSATAYAPPQQRSGGSRLRSRASGPAPGQARPPRRAAAPASSRVAGGTGDQDHGLLHSVWRSSGVPTPHPAADASACRGGSRPPPRSGPDGGHLSGAWLGWLRVLGMGVSVQVSGTGSSLG